MPRIAIRGNKTGNFLKKELWPEEFHCREMITVTRAGLINTLSPGEIVYDADKTGAFGVVPDGALVNAATGRCAVIVDQNIEDIIAASAAASTATFTVAALVKGPCVLRKGGLSYKASITFSEIEELLLAQGFTLAAKSSVMIQS